MTEMPNKVKENFFGCNLYPGTENHDNGPHVNVYQQRVHCHCNYWYKTILFQNTVENNN